MWRIFNDYRLAINTCFSLQTIVIIIQDSSHVGNQHVLWTSIESIVNTSSNGWYLILLALCMESIFVYLYTVLNDLFNSRLCRGLVFWYVLLLHTAAITMICMVLLWSTKCKIFSTCNFKFVLCRSIFCYFISDNGNETRLKLPVSLIPFWRRWKECQFGINDIALIPLG